MTIQFQSSCRSLLRRCVCISQVSRLRLIRFEPISRAFSALPSPTSLTGTGVGGLYTVWRALVTLAPHHQGARSLGVGFGCCYFFILLINARNSTGYVGGDKTPVCGWVYDRNNNNTKHQRQQCGGGEKHFKQTQSFAALIARAFQKTSTRDCTLNPNPSCLCLLIFSI